jgi:cytochrome c oxidase cbb3-type subunit 2
MNHGPLIFLGVLVSFVASWWTFVFAPQVQIGAQQPATVDGALYPTRRAGLAEQGREIYVANGCVHCHSQQVQQDGFTFDLVLTSAGTNADAVAKIIAKVVPGTNATEAVANASEKNPQALLRSVPQADAASAQSALKKAGATAQVVFIPVGPDIKRKWGPRRTVAADYLYEYPVQIGNSRLGPDLSNISARMSDADWHLNHLYDPRSVMPGSIMPAYRYLFETRPIGKQLSPDALKNLSEKSAPPAGKEIVPKPEARLLVTYLQSLRIDKPLFEAPMTELGPPPTAGTNALAGTNAPASTNAPAK